MKDDNILEDLVSTLKKEIESKGNWIEIKRPVLPRLDYNPYVYMDYGRVLGNGLHEARISTITVKYNGEISYSHHL